MPANTSQRFWEKVNKTPGLGPNGDCWEWTAYLNKAGYGVFRICDSVQLAHRVAFVLLKGEAILGLQGCHRCDNPKCVNPEHIFPGTNSENQKDSALKGRHRGAKQTKCRQGHDYTPDNTYTSRAGKRMCKICIKRRSAEATQREVAARLNSTK